MKNLISKLSSIDALGKFRDLYECLKIGDTESCTVLINDLEQSGNLDHFTDYVLAKKDQLQQSNNEDITDEIINKFKSLAYKKASINITVLAQFGLDIKKVVTDKLRTALSNLKEGKGKVALDYLGMLRTEMFPEEGDSSVDLNKMTADAMDFFSDDGMWEWIAEAQKRNFTEEDQEALDMIALSIEDLLSVGIFTDEIIGEE